MAAGAGDGVAWFEEYAAQRLASVKQTLVGACARVQSDEVALAMRRDPASSPHIAARIDEILQRSLLNEREAYVQQLASLCAVKDARIEELEREVASLHAQLQASLESTGEGSRGLGGHCEELQAVTAQLRAAVRSFRGAGSPGGPAAADQQSASSLGGEAQRLVDEMRRHAQEQQGVLAAQLRALADNNKKLLEEVRELRGREAAVRRESNASRAEAQALGQASSLLESEREQRRLLTQRLESAAGIIEMTNAALRDEQQLSEDVAAAALDAARALGGDLAQLRSLAASSLAELRAWSLARVAAVGERAAGERGRCAEAMRQLQERLAQLEGAEGAREQRLAETSTDAERARRQADELDAELAINRAELASASAAAARLEEQLLDSQHECARLSAELDSAARRASQAAEERDAVVAAVSAALQSPAGADAGGEGAAGAGRGAAQGAGAAMMERVRQGIAATVEPWRKRVEELEQRSARLAEDNSGLSLRALKAESERDALTQEIQRLKRRVEALEHERAEVEKLVAHLRSRDTESVAEYEDKAKQLTGENTALNVKLVQAESDLENLKQELRRSKRLAERSERERVEAERELARMRSKQNSQSDKERRQQEVLQQMAAKDREIETLHSQLTTTSEKISLESVLQSSSRLASAGIAGSRILAESALASTATLDK
eukprot:m51a1_g6082 hypothetical protein (674) ;mRNA; f:3783-6353